MTPQEMIAYTDELSLVTALWWFIENASDEANKYSEVFFRLRGRVREASDKEAEVARYARELRQSLIIYLRLPSPSTRAQLRQADDNLKQVLARFS